MIKGSVNKGSLGCYSLALKHHPLLLQFAPTFPAGNYCLFPAAHLGELSLLLGVFEGFMVLVPEPQTSLLPLILTLIPSLDNSLALCRVVGS